MAAHPCAADGKNWKVLQCLFQGLGEAIINALQGNAPAQQAQGMTQVQINQLLQGQANIQQLNQQLLAVLQQQQTQVAAQLAWQLIPPSSSCTFCPST